MSEPSLCKAVRRVRISVLGIVFAAMSASVRSETIGERFDRYMAAWEKECASRKLNPAETTCDILKLRPRNFKETRLVPVEGQPEPVPEEWVSTPEGRFAHSLKLPNLLTKDSGYRDGISSQEYFNHLCKTEAGDFIYKKKEGIKGIFMMRPRRRATDYELQHLYAIEDPYGEISGEYHSPAEYFVQPAIGKYKFLEYQEGDKKYRRYSRSDKPTRPGSYQTVVRGKAVLVPYVVKVDTIKMPASRYGFVWRGIVRPSDRLLGIAGSEVIVFDLSTREILGVRRGYVWNVASARSRRIGSGVWWLAGKTCPNLVSVSNHSFIEQILKPDMEGG
ncbi:MAG TPA: hypothetical protein VFV71_11835 [Burkholderiales bacterium]|nr:hypothetical protein [Burkholderiales bacterium]